MADSITLKSVQNNGSVTLVANNQTILLQGKAQGPRGIQGIQGDPATNLVTSVAGRQGVVTLVKADVGLSNVDNTNDLSKPISTATQTALDTKATTTALNAHASNTSNPHSVTKAQVGLGNVDNTADANKPVSTATQTALDGKFTQRTITGTTNQISVTNGDGVSGNPTLSLPQNIDTSATPTFSSLTAGTDTDVLGTALSVIRNNVAVGRIDNNASGLRVQAQNGSLQLRGTGNTGIAIDASGNAVVAGTITGANLSGTNTGDQPLGSRTITGTTNQVTVTNGNGVSGNPTLSLPSAITTPGSLTITGNNSPQADSTYTLGTSSLYWKETYTDRLYLNATAYLDGGTAGTANLTGNLGILATSGSATHSLTLGSTSTGIALYNTSDQTTNYERVRQYWSSNKNYIKSEWGGTGTPRNIVVSVNGVSSIEFSNSITGIKSALSAIYTAGVGAGTHFTITNDYTNTNSSGTVVMTSIVPLLSQTGTAGYTALLINPTETTTGSGAKNLIDAQVGGVSRFKVTNGGMPELGVTGEGIVMKSPDGTRYKVTVANGGTIAVAAA